MLKKLVFTGLLSLIFSAAQAEEDRDFNHFSVSLNAIPSLQNSTDSSVPGESNISDKAYQYQFNVINKPEDFIKGMIGQRLDYYSLRAFAYKQAYKDPEVSGTGADGVSSIEGIAFLYGQRYLMADKGYQGFGLGWYAGVAMIKDTWVQKCCGATPAVENKGIPVAAAEVFYKFNATPNIYIEPGVTVAYEQKGTSPINLIPALIIGGAF